MTDRNIRNISLRLCVRFLCKDAAYRKGIIYIHSLLDSMNRLTKTVLLTGLFAGTTDLLYAYTLQYLKTGQLSEKLLNYIAGGVLGLKTSMAGGNWAAFVGLICHYSIAMIFTIFFFLVFPKIKILHFNKYLVGMLYAVFADSVMTWIVVPLSAIHSTPEFSLARSYIYWIFFGVVFGIPIVYNAYRYYGSTGNGSHR